MDFQNFYSCEGRVLPKVSDIPDFVLNDNFDPNFDWESKLNNASGCVGILRRFGAKSYNYHSILLFSLAVLLLIALVYCLVWILIVIMQSLWGFLLSGFSYVFILGNERYNERGFL